MAGPTMQKVSTLVSKDISNYLTNKVTWSSIIYNVKSYGAKGDGTTDDTAEVQAAINAANTAGGGIVYFPPGTYRIAGSLTGYKNIQIEGSGKSATILLFDDVAGSGISYTANHSSSVLLASNVAIGDRTVTLVSGGGADYSAGSIIYIQDSGLHNGTFTTFVQSVAGEIVTLQEASPYAFTTASAATAFSYSGSNEIMKGVSIKGLTVQTAGNVTATLRTPLINLTRCLGALVEDVHFDNVKTVALQMNGCRDSTATQCSFDTVGAQGDAISIQSSTRCSSDKCYIINAPFGIIGSRSPYLNISNNTMSGTVNLDNGRGVKIESGCTQCVISGNIITDFGLFAIFISDSFSNVCDNNIIFATGASSSEHGISVGGNGSDLCKHNIVSNNKINNVGGYGVVINPTLGTTAETFCSVVDNNISGTTNGINLSSSRNIVSGNTLDNYGSGGTGLFSIAGTNKNTITGNSFRNGGSGKSIDTSASAGENYVFGNATYGETVILAATDITESKISIIPLRPSGYAAAGLSVTSSTFAVQGYKVFPGTSKYSPSAVYTLVIILGVGNVATTAEYRIASDGAGTVYGTATSNATGRNKIRQVLSNLPSAETIIQEDFRSTDNVNTAIVYSAYIEVSW